MTDIEMLKTAVVEIGKLSLTGPGNWNHANSALNIICAVIEGLENKRKKEEEAHNAAIEKAKANREKQLKEAAERGEGILGGETIKVNADGTTEVVVP